MTIRDNLIQYFLGDLKVAVKRKTKIMVTCLIITFIISLLGLAAAIFSFVYSNFSQSGKVVIIPKNKVIIINNQEYIPVKLIK
jgi:hypothetical protein